MKVLCLGAGLQGLELAYLGIKAGWDMTMVDRRKNPPASGLARTLKADLLELNSYKLAVLCSGFDLIVPAIEDLKLLETVAQARHQEIIPPLAFDITAYRLSSSKILSKDLFKKLKLPVAKDWSKNDQGSFIAKPSGLSGSKGVRFLKNSAEVLNVFPNPENLDQMVIEEWIEGSSYSVEVTSVNGQATSYQVTLLEMDDIYDCCKVISPSGLPLRKENKLKKMAELLATELKLTGLMDLEAIYHQETFKLLEIDARFPSQTPIAFYWSTGVNLLVELAACFIELPPNTPRPTIPAKTKKVSLEQYLVMAGKLIPQGEHIFSNMGPVSVIPGFMGAKEALVAGDENSSHFAVTLINVK
jgi:pyrrolysine biosynthesis protein PylC